MPVIDVDVDVDVAVTVDVDVRVAIDVGVAIDVRVPVDVPSLLTLVRAFFWSRERRYDCAAQQDGERDRDDGTNGRSLTVSLTAADGGQNDLLAPAGGRR